MLLHEISFLQPLGEFAPHPNQAEESANCEKVVFSPNSKARRQF